MMQMIIAGRVGRDAKTGTTKTGTPFTSFSLAVSNGKDKPATWVDCTLWDKRSDSLGRFIKKGLFLTLSGTPGARAFKRDSGELSASLQLNVSQLTFGPSPDRAANQTGEPAATEASAGSGQSQEFDDGFGGDDEIPF